MSCPNCEYAVQLRTALEGIAAYHRDNEAEWRKADKTEWAMTKGDMAALHGGYAKAAEVALAAPSVAQEPCPFVSESGAVCRCRAGHDGFHVDINSRTDGVWSSTKNPNPSGHHLTEASAPKGGRAVQPELDTEASGPEGLGPRESHAIDKDRWCIVRESVLDIGLGGDVRTGGKPELGYALLADATTFESHEAASAAIKEANLPLGWVLMPLSRLLPDVFATGGDDRTDVRNAAKAFIHELQFLTYPGYVCGDCPRYTIPDGPKFREAVEALRGAVNGTPSTTPEGWLGWNPGDRNPNWECRYLIAYRTTNTERPIEKCFIGDFDPHEGRWRGLPANTEVTWWAVIPPIPNAPEGVKR